MKKKLYILPVTVLVLSILAGMFMLIFTTSFSYYLPYNKVNIQGVLNSSKIMKVVCKIEPTKSNYEALRDIYNTQYRNPNFYNQFAEFELPDDYYEMCVKVAKNRYEEAPEKEGTLNGHTDVFSAARPILMPIAVDDFHKLEAGVEYASALYLNGQKKEAAAIIEELIKNDDKMNMWWSTYIKFVVLVHEYEDDEAYQRWMVETEERITAIVKPTLSEDTEYKNYENFFKESKVIKNYKNFDFQK